MLLIIFGAFSGTAQGAVFTMAAGLPFKYMGAVMFGSGICGIGTNLLRGVTLLVYPIEEGSPDIQKNYFLSAILFLSISSLVMVVCLLGQISIVAKNDFFIYYLDWNVGEKFRENFLDKEQEDFDYGLMPVTPPHLNKTLSSSSMSPNSTMRTSQGGTPLSP